MRLPPGLSSWLHPRGNCVGARLLPRFKADKSFIPVLAPRLVGTSDIRGYLDYKLTNASSLKLITSGVLPCRAQTVVRESQLRSIFGVRTTLRACEVYVAKALLRPHSGLVRSGLGPSIDPRRAVADRQRPHGATGRLGPRRGGRRRVHRHGSRRVFSACAGSASVVQPVSRRSEGQA